MDARAPPGDQVAVDRVPRLTGLITTGNLLTVKGPRDLEAFAETL
jgi:hypothetical protein